MSAAGSRLVTADRIPTRVVARAQRCGEVWRMTLICGHVVARPVNDGHGPRLALCHACAVRETHTVDEWDADGFGQVPFPWQREPVALPSDAGGAP